MLSKTSNHYKNITYDHDYKTYEFLQILRNFIKTGLSIHYLWYGGGGGRKEITAVSPCQVVLLVVVSPHTPKGCGFNSWSGYMSRLQV